MQLSTTGHVATADGRNTSALTGMSSLAPLGMDEDCGEINAVTADAVSISRNVALDVVCCLHTA